MLLWDQTSVGKRRNDIIPGIRSGQSGKYPNINTNVITLHHVLYLKENINSVLQNITGLDDIVERFLVLKNIVDICLMAQ